MLLVIGHPRSGTEYVSKVLQGLGLDVRHEEVGRDGIVSWVWAVPNLFAPWAAAAGVRPPLERFDRIWHVVRHPLHVIASSMTEPEISWFMRACHVPEMIAARDKLEAGAWSWLGWNESCERQAEWTFRVEDEETPIEMARRLGVAAGPNAVSKTTNTRPHDPPPTWEELKARISGSLFERIRAKAVGYGYLRGAGPK
ncbi:MAG: hypothetical protein HYY13_10940 [Nitrospirae bacterium]|nr:hypothetical protein [Nitrospirota bacterium]